MNREEQLEHQLEQSRRENALLAGEVQRLRQLNDLEAQVRHLRDRVDAQDTYNKQIYQTLKRFDKELKDMAFDATKITTAVTNGVNLMQQAATLLKAPDTTQAQVDALADQLNTGATALQSALPSTGAATGVATDAGAAQPTQQ